MSHTTRFVGPLLLAGALALPVGIASALAPPRGDTAPYQAGLFASGPGVSGTAVVIDGDTIDIGQVRVRLEGIDAPERAQTCKRPDGGDWRCGAAAKKALARMLAGRTVRCAHHGTGKYGRMLGVCHVGGREINAELVRRGLAWAFVKYSSRYLAVEAAAKAAKVGIWQGAALPAWDYRAGSWATAETTAPQGCAIKGNISRHGHIYHMPWSQWYARVRIKTSKGERWFCSEADAMAAGWRPVAMR